MPKRFHSSLILAIVFVLGIAGGVAGMVWAWPGLQAKYFHPQHRTFIQILQKSLNLTPAQVPQVQAIVKDGGERRHAIHLQFVPQYTQACEAYRQIRSQEWDAYEPVQQQVLNKMHAVLTPTQWATFQKRFTAPPNQRTHDPCLSQEQGPGGPGGNGGRGGRGRGGRRGGPPSP